MNAENMVNLIEEMVDLKIQRYAESQLRPTPEIAAILAEKKMTDARRLKQIRDELVRSVTENGAQVRHGQLV